MLSTSGAMPLRLRMCPSCWDGLGQSTQRCIHGLNKAAGTLRGKVSNTQMPQNLTEFSKAHFVSLCLFFKKKKKKKERKGKENKKEPAGKEEFPKFLQH